MIRRALANPVLMAAGIDNARAGLDFSEPNFIKISMLIRKAYRYRLKTDATTWHTLAMFGGCCRFVWNKALALQKQRLDMGERCLPYSKMANLLTQWKNEPETAFLQSVHSQILQQSLMFLDRALTDAFDKSCPKRFPKFKKKGLHDSFRYPQGWKVSGGNQIYLPKIGSLGFHKSRDIQGEIRNVTVSRRGTHWYVSIQTEAEVPEPMHPSRSTVGIDMGVRRFATLSNGTFYQPLNSFRTLRKKLAAEQRKLSRKVKGSRNYHKQKAVITRVHIRIADARNDYLHKISTTISKNHAVVVLEDLKVANISASAKGTVEKPGRNVRAKTGLNRAILDQGWREFRRMLDYKQLWGGRQGNRCPSAEYVQDLPGLWSCKSRQPEITTVFQMHRVRLYRPCRSCSRNQYSGGRACRVGLWRDGAFRRLREAGTAQNCGMIRFSGNPRPQGGEDVKNTRRLCYSH